jgi:hypothetical protein
MELAFVQPPLFYSGDGGATGEERVDGVFTDEVWRELISSGTGIAAGWWSGNKVSFWVKGRAPKWTNVFGENAFTRLRVVDFASPGLLTGLGVTFVTTGLVANVMENAEFQAHYLATREELLRQAWNVHEAMGEGSEVRLWREVERLKNGLMLQNYLLTRELNEDLVAEMSSAGSGLAAALRVCGASREAEAKSAKARFEKRVQKAVGSNRVSVEAALDLSNRLQVVLNSHPDEMTRSLRDLNHQFLLKGLWLTDASQLTSELWPEIQKAADQPGGECTPSTVPEFYP